MNTKKDIVYPIGFTAIDNRLFYAQEVLSPNAFSVLIRIYRMSNGYNGKPKSLSNTFFQNYCNISKNTVTKVVRELESKGFITTQKRSRSNTLYSINLVGINNHYLTVINESQDLDEVSTNNVNELAQEMCSNKQNPIKQNIIKENINIPFDVFWDLYDYKKNKSLCITKWHSMTDEERTLAIESLGKYKQSTPDKTYRKYPLNYLENECWNDEHIILVDNQNIAHNNKYNHNNAHDAHNANNVFSASHKEFEPVITAKDTSSTIHTKDDLECNLEALGISSDKGLDDTNNDATVDIVKLSSQIHWSELKAKGMLKNPVNTNAVIPNTDTDKKINEFLARNSSKRFGGICKDIA